MKETNITNTTEEALRMYKETVSPSEDSLKVLLSKIPEKKVEQGGRAVRSPYIWVAITEVVMLFSIMFAVLPTLTKILDDPFYQIDKEVQLFEMEIEKQDLEENILDSSL